MEQAKITSKGQVTIPKKIREKMNLQSGDKVQFKVNEKGDATMHHFSRSITERAGSLQKYAKKEPVSIEEMNEAVKKMAVERFKRSYEGH